MLLISACATSPQTNKIVGLKLEGENPISTPDVEEDDDTENQAVLDQAGNKITTFPAIPDEDHERVNKWVGYFTGRGRKWMEVYLERSGRYLPLMKSILKDNGLPEDLVYIAMIESGFASSIRSRANAVGYWQFIAPTGRRYGLTINSLLDERRDPLKSTQAAADYFKSLYNLFNSWYLAFAAYNGGENRVVRSVMKYQTRDFWDLVENRRALRKETINYIPKFLAARLIAKNPEKYGFKDLGYHEAISFDEIKSEKSVYLKKLASEMGIDYQEIKTLNPQFTTEYAPAYKNSLLTIRVPKDTIEKAKVALANSFIDNQAFLAKLQSNSYTKFKVRRGDTLITIAHRFNTSVSRLRSLNSMGNGSMLRAGRHIKVPMGTGFEARAAIAAIENLPTKLPPKRDLSSLKQKLDSREIPLKSTKSYRKIHIVRKGDNLIRIARKYQVDLEDLLAINKLKNASRIFAGKRIFIPN